MLNALKKEYPGGKEVCYDISDGTKFCMGQRAWSVFYAYMRKHGKDESKGLSEVEEEENIIIITPDLIIVDKNVNELTDEELALKHAESHADFVKIGDQACKDHFDVANEMIDRGLSHASRSKCDVIVGLSRKLEASKDDEDEVLKAKWKSCKAMMFRLSNGMAFNHGVFKGVPIDEQKKMVRNLARTIRRAMFAKGWKPKRKGKAC